MDKLNFFVCENFAPEFQKIIQDEGFSFIKIKSYKSLCLDKSKKILAKELIENSLEKGEGGIVVCGKNCEFSNLVQKNSSFEVFYTDYCLESLANKKIIDYISSKGGYIVTLGWLNNWKQNIENLGFDQQGARNFYKDFSKELVFFDSGIDKDYEQKLKDLSEYLDLPYFSIDVDLEPLRILIKTTVNQWKLNQTSIQDKKQIAELQEQCAQYFTIFDLLGKITNITNKRDAIEKIKEIFIMVLGAQNFHFFNTESDIFDTEAQLKAFFENKNENFLFQKEQGTFYIKIQNNNKVFGMIKAGDFQFPQYIDRYLNFAIDISSVCALVLSNIEQYEKILKSEQALQYLSYHDSLTSLFNRTYINELISKNQAERYLSVFFFDIDKLKYVNDTFGHAEGDELIKGMAEVLKKCFRESDILARIGGDEFVAILPDCDLKMAEMFRTRIDEIIEKANNNQRSEHLKISVSIGFVGTENKTDTIEALMKKADELMYIDKLGKKRA